MDAKWRFDRAFAAGRYDDALRRLVLCHKFHGDRAARRFLVAAIVRAYRRIALGRSSRGAEWTVTSVPQHFWRRLRRGRDPGRELAADFARSVALPYRALLRKKRSTTPQVHLSREERRRNPRGSFSMRRVRPVPARVLLIEDVMTTCATASECARTLKKGGAREVAVLAVARS